MNFPCALTVGREYPAIKLPCFKEDYRVRHGAQLTNPSEHLGYELPWSKGLVIPELVINREGKIACSGIIGLNWSDTHTLLHYWEELFHFKKWEGLHADARGVANSIGASIYNWFPINDLYDARIHGFQWRYPSDTADAKDESRKHRNPDK